MPIVSDSSGAAGNIRVFQDPDALARAAAEEFRRRAVTSIQERGRFTVVLSGGSTPVRLFEKLAAGVPGKGEFSWSAVHLFWGDERPVPFSHPESNFGSARAALLSRVEIGPANLHPVPLEGKDAAAAAIAYEKEIRSFFKLPEGRFPRFDLVFLGMGSDGHTASLFPGTPAVQESKRLVVAPWLEKLGNFRITMTIPVFNQARCVIFLVAGAGKAVTVRKVLEEEDRPGRFPAGLIRPASGELFWFLDRPAAGKI